MRVLPQLQPGLLATARRFAQDFARFAGRRGVWVALAVTGGAALESVSLVLIIPLLGIVIGNASGGRLNAAAARVFHAVGVASVFGRLALLLGLFAVLMVVRALVISYRDVSLAKLQIGFVEDMRARIAERLAGADWIQVVRLRHARVTHLMSGDIQRIGSATHFLLQLAVAGAILAVQCGLALALAPGLAAVAFVLLIASAAALVPMMRRANELGVFATSANLALLNSTSQFLGGLKLAISQNLQASFVSEFRATLRELTNRQIDNIRRQTNSRLVLTTLSAVVGAVLVLVGFGLLHVSAPVLITLLLIIGRMNGPASQIQQGAQQLAFALPAYEAVQSLAAELAPRPLAPKPQRPSLPSGTIVFERVSFFHPAESGSEAPRGVGGVSLSIGQGELVGVVGPSGAGKTTFADLLVGLVAPQDGRIRIGGALLDEDLRAHWRDGVSYVSQDPFLFHDTIRRNLAWANPKATEEQMWDALERAGARALVERMALGLDTMLGERGTLISGGERQRIALARALLRPARLLVLDEATSAIDIAGEQAILDRLLAEPLRPTIVMIAHRAESLARCRRILRFEHGRLVEDGAESAAS